MRCISWLDNDFNTIQYYPNQQLLENQDFLQQEPTFRMKINKEKKFTYNISRVEKGGLILFDSNSSKRDELNRNYNLEKAKNEATKEYLKFLRNTTLFDKEVIVKHGEKIYEWLEKLAESEQTLRKLSVNSEIIKELINNKLIKKKIKFYEKLEISKPSDIISHEEKKYNCRKKINIINDEIQKLNENPKNNRLAIKREEKKLENCEEYLEILEDLPMFKPSDAEAHFDKIYNLKEKLAESEKRLAELGKQSLLLKEKIKNDYLREFLDQLKNTNLVSNTTLTKHNDKVFEWTNKLALSDCTLKELLDSIKLYDKKNSAVNFIIQVIESDKEFQKSGEKIQQITNLMGGLFDPWKAARVQYHTAEMEKREVTEEGFKRAFVVSPTVVPTMVVDMIKAGMNFIGTVLKNNQDDVVLTVVGVATAKNIPDTIKEEGYAEIKLEFLPTDTPTDTPSNKSFAENEKPPSEEIFSFM